MAGLSLPSEILDFYSRGTEAERLFRGIGPLELARTQELLQRYLPPPPATILDVGGGPGIYACWFATLGYEAHLVDAVPMHVEQARQASAAQPAHPVASMEVGDARALRSADESVDAVLLHGPLYHLTERRDRLAAIDEARRVLRTGGFVFGIGIPRYASTHVGLVRGWVDDDEYLQMIERELTDGQHIQPPNWPNLFTTAFFHRPDELGAELEAAGLAHQETLAIEGPGWLLADFKTRWQDERQRAILISIVRRMEREPVALGLSPHLMAVARKKGPSATR